jgi:MFS family permease
VIGLNVEALNRRQLVRAAIASSIGTTIEWYDTVLYALVVGLYLGRLFFPSRDPFVSGLEGFGSLFVSFLSRPIGSIIFGHFGDRAGRKATLIATLLLAGVCSFLVGLLPTYAQIGIWAPVFLVILRALLGIALGGEWGGSVLLALEWGNRARRGFWSSWPQIGLPAAFVLGFAALRVSALIVGPQSYWAWRLPFLFGIVLILVGLYVRLGVLETPTFAQLLERRRIERRPVLSVLRRNWGEVLQACFAQSSWFVPNVISATFLLTYATQFLHIPATTVGVFELIGGLIGVIANPVFGFVSDLIGRKLAYILGIAAMFVYAVPFWIMLDTRNLVLVLVAIMLLQAVVAMMTGPMAAFTAEAFTGRLRYSGASLGASLAAITAGGPAPTIALSLLHAYHSVIPIGFYMMLACAVGFVAALLLKERSAQDLAVEYDEVPLQAESVTSPAGA